MPGLTQKQKQMIIVIMTLFLMGWGIRACKTNTPKRAIKAPYQYIPELKFIEC